MCGTRRTRLQGSVKRVRRPAHAQLGLSGDGRRDGHQAPCAAGPETSPARAQGDPHPSARLSGPHPPPPRRHLYQRPRRRAPKRPLPLAAQHVPGRRRGRSRHSGGDRRLHRPSRQRRRLAAELPGHCQRLPARHRPAVGPRRRPALGHPESRPAAHPERRHGHQVRGAGCGTPAPRQPRLHHEQALRAHRGAAGPPVQGRRRQRAAVQSAQAVRQHHAGGRERPGRGQPAERSREDPRSAGRHAAERGRAGAGRTGGRRAGAARHGRRRPADRAASGSARRCLGAPVAGRTARRAVLAHGGGIDPALHLPAAEDLVRGRRATTSTAATCRIRPQKGETLAQHSGAAGRRALAGAGDDRSGQGGAACRRDA